MAFEIIKEFELALAQKTGAPYAIMTDTCTNALELCFRYDAVTHCDYPKYTYLSIHQLMHRLNIEYELTDEEWIGEYQFNNTRIWDSARLLADNMFRPGTLQCLSFGFGKPLQLGWGGAILTDDEKFYNVVIRQRYDGRDLNLAPWQNQELPKIGYHMRPTPELAKLGLELLPNTNPTPVYKAYPDGKQIVWANG